MKYRFTRKSRNAKTGPIPVTTTEQKSCPKICPLKNNGCYADGGPLAIVWRETASLGISLGELCKSIRALPDGQLWRHNQAGDLPHTRGEISFNAVSRLIEANTGKRGFTYTHHEPDTPENARIIQRANKHGFTINLSANTPAHADKLVALGIAPVVAVLPEDHTSPKQFTPGGNPIVVCPVVTGKRASCAECKLCAVSNRKSIIGFPAHGMRKRAANDIAAA